MRSPLPTPNPIRDIAFGNGLWVAVGDSGTVISSSDDGQTWTLQNSGVTNANARFSGIVFTNNLFVAVGTFGLAATSPDGTNWTLRSAGTVNSYWSAVTFGAGKYVAVGQDVSGVTSNNVAVSLDGTNWSVFPSGHNGLISDVTFAQGVFVAVGAGIVFNGGVVLASNDGTNWTKYVTNFYANLTGVTYGNGQFVGVGGSGTVLSPNGTTWTLVTNSFAPARIGVAYGNGVYVSVGASAPYYVDGVSYTSTNGTNWVLNYLSSSETVRFANGRFAAVGAPTTPLVQLTATINFSTNGQSWNNLGNYSLGGAFPKNYGLTEHWHSLVYGNGQFAFIPDGFSVRLTTNFVDYTAPYTVGNLRTLAFGDNQLVAADTSYGYTTFASSANAWSHSGSANGILNALCYSNSLWVGVGNDGYIATSSDAVNWTDISTSITNQLNSVTAGAGVFVAVGEGGVVAKSANGTTWTSQSLGATNELRAVAYGGGIFVAVGVWGKIFTSSDGATWVPRSSGTLLSLNAVTRCFGRFVAVGDGGLVLSSPDGITWTRAPALLDQNLLSVAASPTLVAAVGDNGELQTSTDGLNWKRAIGSGVGNMWKIIYYNGQFIAAMDGGVGLSTGGRSWQFKGLPSTIYSVLGANGLILAAGTGDYLNQGAIEVSADNGLSWSRTNVLLTIGSYLNGLAYGNGTYVAVGQYGSLFSSVDASNWIARSSGTLSQLNDVAFGNNAFVAVLADSTNVLRSVNGTTWAMQSTGLTGTYKSIVFRNGLFYAAGTRIATSSDGISWNDRGSPYSGLNGLDKTPDGRFAACGPGGTLLVSSNLTSWATIPTLTLQDLNSVTFGGDTFVAVGRGGLVYQSDYMTNTPVSIVIPPAPTSALEGGDVTFSVSVAGRAPFSYQWFKNNHLISGARSSTLTLTSVSTNDAGSYSVVVNNDISSQTSASATLAVLVVTVTAQPDNLYAFIGGDATFTASVVGATPLAYQWFRSYQGPILDATNATLTFTNAQPDDADYYSVEVTLAQGQMTSQDVYFQVLSSLDDIYLYGYLGTDPSYQQVPIGSMATINAVVQAPTPLSYQWNVNGTNIVGATNSTLVIPNVQLTSSGDYSYTATFTLGTVTNIYYPATLTVYYAEPPVITGWQPSSPGNFRLSFTGLTNRYYALEYATTLMPPIDWQNYDSLLLNTNPAKFNIAIPIFGAEPQAYFRVRILPP